MSEIDQEILGLLLDEASEALHEWEQHCLNLEKEPSQDYLDALFRVAHNVKGASRSVGLMDLGAFVHIAEDLINMLKLDPTLVSSENIGVLLDAQSLLHDWIEQLRENSSYKPDTLQCESKIKAAMDEIAVNSDTPSLDEPLEEETEADLLLERQSQFPSIEEIQAQLNENSKKEEFVEPSPIMGAGPVPAPKPQSKIENQESKRDLAKNKKKEAAARVDKTIRVSANKLDELMQLIGELSIHQSIISHSKQTNDFYSEMCSNAIYLSNKLTKDLQTLTLSLRMQPVAGLFQRLERVGRDVAKVQDKPIHFELQGTEVSLDKTVIERITDPLIHVIRNAVDHGIEDQTDRNEKNKAEAVVSIIAAQDAGGVVIIVKDNGKGIDPNIIYNKALSKGLIREGMELTEADIYNLILLPGFSTREQVTDISGRGVGMDVVKQAVDELGGNIQISSELGNGTQFRITLPTNLSIIDALVVKVGTSNYAVPMKELVEIIDLQEYEIEKSGTEGKMINLREVIVPVEHLVQYLPAVSMNDYKTSKESKTEEGVPALVVQDGSHQIAFEVDNILGQQQIVVRPLSDQLAGLPGYSGGTILGNGEPGMIINMNQMTKSYFKRTKRKGVA